MEEKEALRLQGVAVVAITPFSSNFKVEEKELRLHTRFLIKSGISILISGASVGECYALTVEERKRIMDIVADEASPFPFVVCVNHTDERIIFELSDYASKVGAYGIMIMPPYYRKLSDREVFNFYRKISEKIDTYIFLYNHPLFSKVDMSVELLSSLADMKNVIALKECTFDLPKFERVMRILSKKISVFNGQGERMEPYAHLMGAHGFISAISNFLPRVSLKLYEASVKSDFKTAQKIHDLLMPLFDFMCSPKRQILSVIKEAVNIVGFKAGKPRPPLEPLTRDEKDMLAKLIKQIDTKIDKGGL